MCGKTKGRGKTSPRSSWAATGGKKLVCYSSPRDLFRSLPSGDKPAARPIIAKWGIEVTTPWLRLGCFIFKRLTVTTRVVRSKHMTMTPQEMARRSNDVQKQKLGDKYPEEMSRRAKLPRGKREPKQGIGAKKDEQNNPNV